MPSFQLNTGSDEDSPSGEDQSPLVPLPTDLSEELRQSIEEQLSLTSFRLKQILYSSSMSTVFLIAQLDSDEQCVLKISLSARKQFDFMAKIQHPHIATVTKATPNGFIMHKYSSSLDRVLSKHRYGLSARQALRIVANISHALISIKKQGIIHGDVKPSNVLTDGQNYFLADFGNCYTAGDSNGKPSQTLTYRSPEALISSGGSAVDVWGLGCILYECLTGQKLISQDIEDETQLAALFKNIQLTSLLKRVKQLLLKSELDFFYPLLEKTLEYSPQSRIEIEQVLSIVENIQQ